MYSFINNNIIDNSFINDPARVKKVDELEERINAYLEKYDLKCITLEDIINILFKKDIISKKEFESLLTQFKEL